MELVCLIWMRTQMSLGAKGMWIWERVPLLLRLRTQELLLLKGRNSGLPLSLVSVQAPRKFSSWERQPACSSAALTCGSNLACFTWWLSGGLLRGHWAADVTLSCPNSGINPSSTMNTTAVTALPTVLCEWLPLWAPPRHLVSQDMGDGQQRCLNSQLHFFLLSVLQFSFHLPRAETLPWL